MIRTMSIYSRVRPYCLRITRTSQKGATEVCDGQDNDCDAGTFATDEETDLDGDGAVTCLDCDDGDATAYPGNTEACDGVDNDCDGVADGDDDRDWAQRCGVEHGGGVEYGEVAGAAAASDDDYGFGERSGSGDGVGDGGGRFCAGHGDSYFVDGDVGFGELFEEVLADVFARCG